MTFGSTPPCYSLRSRKLQLQLTPLPKGAPEASFRDLGSRSGEQAADRPLKRKMPTGSPENTSKWLHSSHRKKTRGQQENFTSRGYPPAHRAECPESSGTCRTHCLRRLRDGLNSDQNGRPQKSRGGLRSSRMYVYVQACMYMYRYVWICKNMHTHMCIPM